MANYKPEFIVIDEISEIKLNVFKNLNTVIDEMFKEIPTGTDPFAEDLCPYFGQVWPSGRALAEHLQKMGGWLQGKTVLEIGCGIGLPSFICAKLGAQVLATDFHPDVEDIFQKNIELNTLNNLNIRYQRVNWKDPQPDLGKFDFIIGSDILYENQHAREVPLTLLSLCHKESHVIIADPGRTYLQKFMDEMKLLKFRSEMFIYSSRENESNITLADGEKLPDKILKDIFVFVFQKV